MTAATHEKASTAEQLKSFINQNSGRHKFVLACDGTRTKDQLKEHLGLSDAQLKSALDRIHQSKNIGHVVDEASGFLSLVFPPDRTHLDLFLREVKPPAEPKPKAEPKPPKEKAAKKPKAAKGSKTGDKGAPEGGQAATDANQSPDAPAEGGDTQIGDVAETVANDQQPAAE